MIFNDAATGLREFKEKRETFYSDLSEILGFDIRLLNKVDQIKLDGFNVEFNCKEQSFEQSEAYDQPMFFLLKVKAKKSFLFGAIGFNQTITRAIFKKDEEWFLTTVNLDTRKKKPSSPEEIRKAVLGWMAQLNIKLEDILDIPEPIAEENITQDIA